jgi:hypothetical protein
MSRTPKRESSSAKKDELEQGILLFKGVKPVNGNRIALLQQAIELGILLDIEERAILTGKLKLPFNTPQSNVELVRLGVEAKLDFNTISDEEELSLFEMFGQPSR